MKVFPKHQNNGGRPGNIFVCELRDNTLISSGLVVMTRRNLVNPRKTHVFIQYNSADAPVWVEWNSNTIVNVKENTNGNA